MDVYLVFNELCLLRPCAANAEVTIQMAQQRMEDFGNVITHARRSGVKSLRVKQGFFELPLTPKYTIRDWKNDSHVDRELRRRIQSAATALDELEEFRVAESKKLTFEFEYEGQEAEGLGFSYLLESIAVSLNTEACWQESKITLEIEELVEHDDDDVDVVVKQETVRHVSKADHFGCHRDWLQQERFATSVQDGHYLLSKIDEWFPNLVMIDHMKEQIDRMRAGTPQMRQLVIKLFELENYCCNWTQAAFDSKRLKSKVSPESQTVRDSKSMRGQRTFQLPDGHDQFFEWHLRLTPDAWRLYFLPDAAKHKMYIGYVGPKLQTAKHKT